MFQRFPIFQRLISWTKPDAPVERESREYEWYDHNSLVAEEPDLRALVPGFMKRDFDLPSRPEMLAGLTEFANRAQGRSATRAPGKGLGERGRDRSRDL